VTASASRLATAAPALPGVALGAAGLFHPHALGYATAERWMWVHVVGLFVFPMVGLALARVVQGRGDAAAWLVRLGGYLFATAYTALDVISGLAAGYVTLELGEGQPRPEAVSLMFGIGSTLGDLGSWGLIGAALVLVVDRARSSDVVGLTASGVMVLGAVLVHSDHIFAPVGAAGMLLVGLSTGVVAHQTRTGQTGQNRRWVGSSMPRSAS
jgi:hypothetical protein